MQGSRKPRHVTRQPAREGHGKQTIADCLTEDNEHTWFSLTPCTLSDTSQPSSRQLIYLSTGMLPHRHTFHHTVAALRLRNGSLWLSLLLGLLLMFPQAGNAANKPAPIPPPPPVLAQAKQLIEKGDPESAA